MLFNVHKVFLKYRIRNGEVMRVKRIMCMMLVVLLFVLSFPMTTEAATKGWSLRYVKGAPQSEQILGWSRSVTTTENTTTFVVSKVDNGAKVFVYTSNGISANYTNIGSIAIKADIGKRIYASASYQDYGYANMNTSRGSIIY